MRGSKVVLGSNKSLGSKRVLGRNSMYSELPSGSSPNAEIDTFIQGYTVGEFWTPGTFDTLRKTATEGGVHCDAISQDVAYMVGQRSSGTNINPKQSVAGEVCGTQSVAGENGAGALGVADHLVATITSSNQPILMGARVLGIGGYSGTQSAMIATGPGINYGQWYSSAGNNYAYAGSAVSAGGATVFPAAGVVSYMMWYFNGATTRCWVDGVEATPSANPGTDGGLDTLKVFGVNAFLGAAFNKMLFASGAVTDFATPNTWLSTAAE